MGVAADADGWAQRERPATGVRGHVAVVLSPRCPLELALRIGQSVRRERELDAERSRTGHPNTRSVGREVVSEVSGVRYASSGDLSIAYQVIGDGPRDLMFVPGIISHVELQR